MNPYNEDRLVQATTADYLRDALGWESIHAYDEVLGERGTLGRLSDRELVGVGLGHGDGVGLRGRPGFDRNVTGFKPCPLGQK